MSRHFFFALFLLLPYSLHGAEKAAPAVPLTDPLQLKARYTQVLARPEFQRQETLDMSASFEDWLSQWLTRLGERWNNYTYAGELHGLATLLMFIMLILVFSGLFYTALKLFRHRRLTWPEKKETQVTGKLFPSPEAYERDITAALRAGNWHEAWLAVWRQFLAQLEHGQWIDADPTLTNREYLAQLRQRALPVSAETQLRSLVDTYDRTIYGHRTIGETDWLAFQTQVEHVTRLLGLGKTAARKAAS